MSQSSEMPGFYDGEENPLDGSIAGGPKYKSAEATDVREDLIEIRNGLGEHNMDGLEVFDAVADSSRDLDMLLGNGQYRKARAPLGELIGATAGLAKLAALYEQRSRLYDNHASEYDSDSSENLASAYENSSLIAEKKGREVVEKLLVPAAAEITRETGTSVREAATDEKDGNLQDWWNTITKQ